MGKLVLTIGDILNYKVSYLSTTSPREVTTIFTGIADGGNYAILQANGIDVTVGSLPLKNFLISLDHTLPVLGKKPYEEFISTVQSVPLYKFIPEARIRELYPIDSYYHPGDDLYQTDEWSIYKKVLCDNGESLEFLDDSEGPDGNGLA